MATLNTEGCTLFNHCLFNHCSQFCMNKCDHILKYFSLQDQGKDDLFANSTYCMKNCSNANTKINVF